jgi:hypothetical protein
MKAVPKQSAENKKKVGQCHVHSVGVWMMSPLVLIRHLPGSHEKVNIDFVTSSVTILRLK